MKKPDILAAIKANPQIEFAVVEFGVNYHKSTIQGIQHLNLRHIRRVVILDLAPKALMNGSVPFTHYIANPGMFRSASTGSKSNGFLVHDLDNNEVWVTPYSDFVTEHARAIALINAQLQREAEAKEEEARRAAQQATLKAGAKEREQSARDELKALITEIIGQDASDEVIIRMDTQVQWVQSTPVVKLVGSVEMKYSTMYKFANEFIKLQRKEQEW